MKRVSPEAVAYCKDLSFSFTKTLRGETPDMSQYSSYTFILDVDGTLYQAGDANENQASIILVGGLDKFINSKTINLYSNFYVTEQQKVTLYRMIKKVAEYSDNAVISSDNEKLEQVITALYSNYCG